MRGKSSKGGTTTTNPTGAPGRLSASPGTIRKYMVQDNTTSPGKGPGAKSKIPDAPPKVNTRRQAAEESLGLNIATLATLDEVPLEGQREGVMPTKNDIAEMFARLETFIRAETDAIRGDMGHILRRVEEAELAVESQRSEIGTLRSQLEEIQREQRDLRYKLEDQENRSRRKNLRIRGIPEPQGEGEDLQEKINQIFGGLINLEDKPVKLDRVHRLRKPAQISRETPRDVIVRFHNYQDKEKIRTSSRNNHALKYGESSLQIYPDLANETRARKRVLRPLLDLLKAREVHYSWGFPACLIGKKDGRSATLRFPEETQNFCRKLDIPLIEIPGWWERGGGQNVAEDTQNWKPVYNRRGV